MKYVVEHRAWGYVRVTCEADSIEEAKKKADEELGFFYNIVFDDKEIIVSETDFNAVEDESGNILEVW